MLLLEVLKIVNFRWFGEKLSVIYLRKIPAIKLLHNNYNISFTYRSILFNIYLFLFAVFFSTAGFMFSFIS